VIPDLSVLWVISFVLLLTIIVQRLLFGPLLRVMSERYKAIAEARELAVEAERKASAVSEEYEAQVMAARNEVYREMDAMRRQALERRSELLTLTRQEADATRAEALQRLRSTAEEARKTLDVEAESLSQSIAERVLERQVS
jgi:F-type H+-transporting ATPase subunit b